MDKRLKDMSNAFSASLSFGFRDNDKDYSLNKEDLVIKKYAGINIYQPTADNIESFIRKYVLNELAFFGQTLDVGIQLNPQEMDSMNSEYVSDANGAVTIKFLGKVIELPFMVVDGELVPFDVIQIEGQRVPYSRENIKKVLEGLKKWTAEKGRDGMESPYVGLAKRVNPSTAPGFLGSVLQIRNQAVGSGSNINGNYIYASKVDETLEKLATMKELTIDDLKKLEAEMEKQAYQEVKFEMEKIAEDAAKPEDKEKLKLFEKMKNVQYENAHILPSGTAIAFPEKEGNEIRMTYGIVVDDYMGIANQLPKKVKIVITQDARVKILSESERFLCFKAPDAIFKIKHESLSSLEEGDVFMAFDGNKALFPCEISFISRRTYGSGDRKNDIETRTYNIVPVHDHSRLASLLSDSENKKILDSRINVALCTLENAKFLELPYGEFIKRKSEELGMEEFKLSNLMPKHSTCISYDKVGETNKYVKDSFKETNLVFATDPETRVIKVKGVITDYIRNKDDLDKLAYLGEGEGVFEKTAAIENNKVKVVLRDRKRGAYDVDIDYIDKSKQMFKNFRKSYKAISKDDVKQLLRIIGYNNIEAQEIVYKAGNGPQAMFALPKNPNIQALQGAQVQNLTKTKMKNAAKSMVNPRELSTALAATIIGSMLMDSLESSPENVQQMAAQLGSYASDGRTLSSAFEKIAQEKESKSSLEVAKLMSLSAMFNEKVATTLTGQEVYPRIYEVARDIVENSAHLEKTAYDLMQLKALQYKNRNEAINPNYIQSAVNQLDALHKVAYGVCSSKYDMNEVLEKSAKIKGFNFKNLPKNRVAKAIGNVSNKTGMNPATIAGILAAQGLIGAGVTAAGAKALDGKEKVDKQAVEEVISEFIKEASLASTLGGAVAGGLYGAGDSYNKAVTEIKERNPNALPSDYSNEAGKKAFAGAAKGIAVGALAGTGAKVIKDIVKSANEETQDKEKSASELLDERFKQAEMNVPTEEEKEKAKNIAPEDMPLKDIDCEVCGYKGQPDYQGFCPECGTLGGIKPAPNDSDRSTEPEPMLDYGGYIAEESSRAFEE